MFLENFELRKNQFDVKKKKKKINRHKACNEILPNA